MNTVSNYNITESAILNRKSSLKLFKLPGRAGYCFYPFVISVLKSYGFSSVKLSIYNSSAKNQACDLSNYHLIPGRKDVQPLAVDIPRKVICSISK